MCIRGRFNDAAIAEKLEKTVKLIEGLRKMAVYLPMHSLLHRIFDLTGYYDYVSAMPAGETRRANLDMLVEKASSYEATSYRGVFHLSLIHIYQDEQDEASRFEPAERPGMDLRDALMEQILFMKISKEEFRILEYMILNLDDNGYLTEDLPLLCKELKISEEDGERMLKVLWKLEPKGTGARNLRECLLIQLEGCLLYTSRCV